MTTTRTGAPGAAFAQVDQAAREPREPDRVGACRPPAPRRPRRGRRGSAGCAPGARRRSPAGSSSRLNPVSTTTWPWPRATSSRCSTTPDAHLDPALAPRQPGDDGQPVAEGSLAPCRSRASSAPSAVSRAALSSPETSSSTPRCWATDAAVGVGVDQRRPQPARGRAPTPARSPTVVRPGAPAGPQTATTRPGPPARQAGRPSSSGSPRRTGGPSTSASSASGSRVEVVVADQDVDADPRGAGARRSRSRPPPPPRAPGAGGARRPRSGRGRARRGRRPRRPPARHCWSRAARRRRRTA